MAFDTNIFLLGLGEPIHEGCRKVLGIVPQLHLFLPFQVLLEMRRSLNDDARRDAFAVIEKARQSDYEYLPPPLERTFHWESQGAKKGDAVICAALEAADIKFLISENRHFLQEISELPFEVLSAQSLLDRIEN